MKLEFSDRPTTADTPTGPVLIRPFQIVVRVRIGPSAPFPAILDTGHNHNFSISEQHVRDWVRLTLPAIGRLKLGDQIVPRFDAELFLGDFQLSIPDGIAVFPTGPRLPLLGLRGLVRSNLKVRIDGKRMRVVISR